jgi:hypothetical protein
MRPRRASCDCCLTPPMRGGHCTSTYHRSQQTTVSTPAASAVEILEDHGQRSSEQRPAHTRPAPSGGLRRQHQFRQVGSQRQETKRAQRSRRHVSRSASYQSTADRRGGVAPGVVGDRPRAVRARDRAGAGRSALAAGHRSRPSPLASATASVGGMLSQRGCIALATESPHPALHGHPMPCGYATHENPSLVLQP